MKRSRIPSSIIYHLSLILACAMPSTLHAQSVGIGTTTPHPSAALDISSDTSGILIPRMTAVQRDAINSPEVGLMVFVTDDMRFYCYEGSVWEKVGGENTILIDADGDTRIQVEESADDDKIRFDMGGTEYFRMESGHLLVMNTGNSVFLGDSAGFYDDLSNNNSVFIGNVAGRSNTVGNNNIGIGNKALYTNINGNAI